MYKNRKRIKVQYRRLLCCNSSSKLKYEKLQDLLYNVLGKWNVIKCENPLCGILFLYSQSRETKVADFYKEYKKTDVKNRSTNNSLIKLFAKKVYLHIEKARIKKYYTNNELSSLESTMAILPFFLSKFKEILEFKLFYFKIDKKKIKYLDAGCGIGDSLIRMKKRFGWKITDIDFDPKAVKVIKNIYSKIRMFVGAIENSFNLRNDELDVISMLYFVEHRRNIDEVLDESFVILKPGGKSL